MSFFLKKINAEILKRTIMLLTDKKPNYDYYHHDIFIKSSILRFVSTICKYFSQTVKNTRTS